MSPSPASDLPRAAPGGLPGSYGRSSPGASVLEARDRPSEGKVELYINGQLATTIPNTYGYKGGVPGLYAGDAAKIAFKNLQISK